MIYFLCRLCLCRPFIWFASEDEVVILKEFLADK